VFERSQYMSIAFDDVKSLLMSDSPRKNLLQKLLYVTWNVSGL